VAASDKRWKNYCVLLIIWNTCMIKDTAVIEKVRERFIKRLLA